MNSTLFTSKNVLFIFLSFFAVGAQCSVHAFGFANQAIPWVANGAIVPNER